MSKKRGDQDFIDRMNKQSHQGDSRGGQKRTALDLSMLKGDGEDLVWYKPKKTKGKERNRIDILPFLVSQKWYSKLRDYNKLPSEREIGKKEHTLMIPVHYDIGISGDTVLCLSEAFGGKCAICDEMFEKYREDEIKNKEYCGKIRAKWRCFYNVFDHEDEEYEGIKLWDMSYHLFEKYLRQESRDSDEGNVPFADLEVGKIVTFKGREKSFGERKFIEAEGIEFEAREEDYENEVLEEVYQLDKSLIIPDPVEVKKSFYQIEDDDDDEEEEEKKNEKVFGKRKKKDELPEHGKDEDEDEDESDNRCPFDFEFGIDANHKDECEECDEDIFEECVEEQDKLSKNIEDTTKTPKKAKKKSFKRKK